MKKLLTLAITLTLSCTLYAQVGVISADSLRLGNPAGTGGVALFGKTYLKNITQGSLFDSILVRNANGSIRMVPRTQLFAGLGTNNFIQNQNAAAQAANMWINGDVTADKIILSGASGGTPLQINTHGWGVARFYTTNPENYIHLRASNGAKAASFGISGTEYHFTAETGITGIAIYDETAAKYSFKTGVFAAPKATVANAPVNPTDVVRLVDLENAIAANTIDSTRFIWNQNTDVQNANMRIDGNIGVEWGNSIGFTNGGQGIRNAIFATDRLFIFKDALRGADPISNVSGAMMHFNVDNTVDITNTSIIQANKSVYIGINNVAGTPPTDGTLSSGESSTGPTNLPGSDLKLRAGRGTGNNTGKGNILFYTPEAGNSGETEQAYIEKLRIARSGIGINNTNPAEALDVTGKVLVSVAPTAPTGVVRKQDLEDAVAAIDLSSYQTLANLSTDLTASATKYPSVNAVNAGIAAAVAAIDLSGYLPLTAGSGKPLTGSLRFAGNNVEIMGSNSATTGYQYAQFISDGANMFWGINNSAGNFLPGGSAYSGFLTTGNNTSLDIGTNNSVRYSISGSGNHDFKSGAATFGGPLALATNASLAMNISNTDATNGYGVAIQAEGTASTRYAFTVRNLTGNNTYFHVSTETGRTGYIGIGTTQPDYKLDVRGPMGLAGSLTGTSANFSGTISAANLSGTNTGDQTWSTLSGKPSFATVAITGSYSDLNGLPTLNLSDWNTAYGWGDHATAGYLTASSTNTLTNKSGNISQWNNDAGYLTSSGSLAWTNITGKPSFATVATSGAYSDLSGKPTAVSSFSNDAGYITASSTNTLTNKSGNISQWTNDSGYLTTSSLNASTSATPNTIAQRDASGRIHADMFIMNRTASPETSNMRSIIGKYNSSGNEYLYEFSAGAVQSFLGLGSAAYSASSAFRSSSYVPSWSEVTSKPSFATVASSGAYSDLSGKPTAVSSFSNDAGYITSSSLGSYLPLAGGTLSGSLSGTNSSFSGDVSASTFSGNVASNYLNKQGNSYYQANTWIQLNGAYGLYAPSVNGAHFYPNSASSYGAWITSGSKGSYSGIYDAYSGANYGMFDGSGNGGSWDASTGWHYYWNKTHQSLGIGGSTTYSGYRATINGNLYGGGTGYFTGTVTAPTFSGSLSGNASTATSSTQFMSTSHAGTYYLVNNWDGTYWNVTSNHGSPVRVGYANAAGSVAWGNVSGAPTIPTNTNQLSNGAGFITNSYTESGLEAVTQRWASTPYNITIGKAASASVHQGSAITLSSDYSASPTYSQILQLGGDGEMVIFGYNGGWNPNFRMYRDGTAWTRHDFTAGGNITAYSDSRLKNNVQILPSVSDALRNIRAVEYDRIDTKEHQIGVIAQEVQKYFPALIHTGSDEKKTLSMAYQNFTAPLLKGWQEHDVTIQQQSLQLKQQDERIAQLERELIGLKELIKRAEK